MLLLIGGFVAVCCVGGGGLVCLTFGSLAWDARQRNRRLEEIYLSAIAWQRCLDLAFDSNDELDQVRCLEYLEALSEDALELYRDCFGFLTSVEADIVRDLVYGSMTPAETRAKLAKVRSGRIEVY